MGLILATCIWEDPVQRKKPVTGRLRSWQRRDVGDRRKYFFHNKALEQDVSGG